MLCMCLGVQIKATCGYLSQSFSEGDVKTQMRAYARLLTLEQTSGARILGEMAT